ncbi:MAG: AI-2E family transporter [Clostridia bacterium]|nr:AI-2E family transporter [Clostridia bacterium]
MKKFRIRHLDLIPILLIAFLLFKLVFTSGMSIAGIFSTVYSCVSYFIYGLVIAYFLSPFVSVLERRIIKKSDSEKAKNIKRGAVIAAVYVIALGIIVAFVVSVIPAIVSGISDFVENFPEYLANLQNWVSATLGFISPEIVGYISALLSDVAANFTSWAASNIDVGKVGGVVTNAVSGSAKFALNFTFGIAVSIYFLHGKEKLIKGFKRFMYAVMSEEKTNTTIKYARQINRIFHDFILSKLVQAFVVFVLGLLVLVPLGIYFAPVISLVLAITNMIPYIGPWIGSIPCVLLVLLYEPIQAVILLVFILILQLIDNTYIGPKIMSNRVGISPLLAIVGIGIGGTFGGIIGMFVGVPVVAVIKLVFYDNFIEKRLKDKKIDI